jgi:hypothetical protein
MVTSTIDLLFEGITKTPAQNAHAVDVGIRKLLESPIASEFVRIRSLSTLDTAIQLIQHYTEIFQSLEVHGFSEHVTL